MQLYILKSDGRTPEPVGDERAWIEWQTQNPHAGIVRQEQIGGCQVTTRFFGMEMNVVRFFNSAAPQHLFETMGFCDGHVTAQERAATWDEAEANHERVAAAMRAALSLR